MPRVDSGQVRVESAKTKNVTVDMGERSLLSVGNSKGFSVPQVVLENEAVELGDSFQCHYDPQSGAVMFVPGGSNE